MFIAGTALILGACGDDDTDATQGAIELPVPQVAVSVEELKAKVMWSIDPDVEGVLFEYEVYRGKDDKIIGSNRIGNRSITLAIDADEIYKVRVRTLAPQGSTLYLDSGFSEMKEFSYASPSLPQIATPAPVVDAVDTESATLSWSAIDGAKSYQCELFIADTKQVFKTYMVSEPQVVIGSLTHSTDYRFRVKAVAEQTGCDSEWSEEVTFKTLAKETSPTPSLDLQLPASENDGVLRAFPGAEGGGMYTTGGRGGKVYHVTNLNDSGAGSLRAAVEASGARVIVFDVAGTIVLKSDLVIKNSNITIAGQTAPGGGICISSGTVRVDADNVIIRYMRFRLGDTGTSLSDSSDAIWGRYHDNIILDHCSMSWSIDEVASFYANRNFTMQWCLLTESLRNSLHGKGGHGYGGIWGGRNASFHHNMLANHDSRNARIDHPGVYGSYLETHRGNVDFRNNVIWNWGSNTTYGGEDGAFNIVGNYYKPGPASSKRNYFVDAYWYNSSSKVGTAYPKLYMEGNHHAGDYASAINGDNWSGIYYHAQGADPSKTEGQLSKPLAIRADDTKTCYTTTHAATDAFDRVASHAGASLCRDEVDLRAERDSRSGTVTYATGSNGSKNGLIDSQSDVGGWPELKASAEETARASKDTDGDGIPDHYEALLGLDAASAADASATTLDPQHIYTNLDIYLHYLVREITAAQCSGGTYKPLN